MGPLGLYSCTMIIARIFASPINQLWITARVKGIAAQAMVLACSFSGAET
jgi:hypothetical protein